MCDKQSENKDGQVRHKKTAYKVVEQPRGHGCPYVGCDKWFIKKEKLEIHMCSHSPEKHWFCEKCGQAFTCRRYLGAHLKVHKKNEASAANPPSHSVPCEQDGCSKMFTTRDNMKSHLLNVHKGRKPKSVPGVTYPCTFDGCGQRFSFRSTLYRHRKLVHEGGDYKLGRQLVQYTCTYDQNCGKVFNRKNLLKEHQVMEHGKTLLSGRLLPQRGRKIDFVEQVCHHCGMILTHKMLDRHIKLYHTQVQPTENLAESSNFPCHLEGCTKTFNTEEARKVHVLTHIDSPTHSCTVEGCSSSFYLEKNLDYHLWEKHSRKKSACDYQGCGKTFEDQLGLAKHSKIHYDGKMKCPWFQCDNWLTETGQLLPHFISHCRALRAKRNETFVCEVCQLACSSPRGLMIHKRIHKEEALASAKPILPVLVKFTCEEPDCPATFCDQKGFFDHFLLHYIKQECKCDFQGCGQTFKNMISLTRHSSVHFGGKFCCSWEACRKLFSSMFIAKRHLYRHITSKSTTVEGDSRCHLTPAVRGVHSVGMQNFENSSEAACRESGWPLSCHQCFMVFRQETNLASHMETHHQVKSAYVCPTCGKKGRHNHEKTTTRRKNRPHKTFSCDHCEATYATVTSLKFHHLQIHKIGKWPLSCSYCKKGFVSRRELRRHLPTHTKEKPFVCSMCGASFASHTGYRAHMRKHAGKKYVCEVEGCGKTYSTSISFRGHKAQHAGFCKICQHCGKTYRNPYGHKCKAARGGKKTTSNQKPNVSAIPNDQAVMPTFHLLKPPAQHHFHNQSHAYQNQQGQQQSVQHHQLFQTQPQPHQQQQQKSPIHYLVSRADQPLTSQTAGLSSLPGVQQASHMAISAPQILPHSDTDESRSRDKRVPVVAQDDNSNYNDSLMRISPLQEWPHRQTFPVQPVSSFSTVNVLHQGSMAISLRAPTLRLQQQQQQPQCQHAQQNSQYRYNNYVTVFWDGNIQT